MASASSIDSTEYYRVYLKGDTFLKAKIIEEGESNLRLRLETGEEVIVADKHISNIIRLRKSQVLLSKGKVLFTNKNYYVLGVQVLFKKNIVSMVNPNPLDFEGRMVFGRRLSFTLSL